MMGREIKINTENVESSVNKFSEISSDRTSALEARSFWDGIFGKEDKRFSQEDLWDEMVDRDEGEFDFSDAVNNETREIISSYTSYQWESLDENVRKEFIVELKESICDSLGLLKTPDVEFFSLNDTHGCYHERGNYVAINTNLWDDYKELVDTLAHECRHAYQRERADILENKQDEIYKFNYEHYISCKYDDIGQIINYKDYCNQYIEAEARAYAKEFKEII